MVPRILQLIFCLTAIISMAATTASACTCSHHQHLKANVEQPSCHGHESAHPKETLEDPDAHHQENSAGDGNHLWTQTSEPDCICADTGPRASAKSESLKLQKHDSPAPAKAVVVTRPALTITPDTAFHFDKPFYLCDSFYNLAPKRGPPTL
jgi:hypothetical protein